MGCDRCEKLKRVILDLLQGGAHEGPCTNEDDMYDSCDLHVAASKRRDEAARAALADVGHGIKEIS